MTIPKLFKWLNIHFGVYSQYLTRMCSRGKVLRCCNTIQLLGVEASNYHGEGKFSPGWRVLYPMVKQLPDMSIRTLPAATPLAVIAHCCGEPGTVCVCHYCTISDRCSREIRPRGIGLHRAVLYVERRVSQFSVVRVGTLGTKHTSRPS